MFSSAFSVDIDNTPSRLQLSFQFDSVLKDKFCKVPVVDFYCKCVCQEKYPGKRKHALFMSSLFGSINICEQLFSRMETINSETRIRVTDEHLDANLRITTTSVKPDIEPLIKISNVKFPTEENVIVLSLLYLFSVW
jgi:hypothetical protein